MKVLLVSLGCDKTRVDSEKMLGTLFANGYEFTDDDLEAEAAVVNTCCFIADATSESIQTIMPLNDMRLEGSLKALVVVGCLAERYRDEIFKEFPGVDAILGTKEFSKIAETLNSILGREDVKPSKGPERIVSNGMGYAYLKIAEGCDKHCTYCVIPSLRGPYVSVPEDDLVNEARMLAANGVRELILVAQDTTLYGTDLYGEKRLPRLIRRISDEITDIEWIRLMYCYPEDIDDALIEVIRDVKKVVPYLDIPIQSGSDEILKKMGRHTTASEIRALIQKLRDNLPGICIRTTLITGFPGEGPADHKATKQLVKELKFDRLGVFTYSKEDGTPAAKLKGQIAAPLKKSRRTELMTLQQGIAFEKAKKLKDRVMRAIIEGYIREDDVYVARTYMDAPDVDGQLFITGVKNELMSGDMLDVKITGARGYDLTGTPA